MPSTSTTTSTTIPEWWYHLKQHGPILCFGQIICILGSITSATQSQLTYQCQWSAPAFSVSLFYLSLTLFFIPLYWKQQLYKKQQHVRLQTQDTIMNNNDNNNNNDLNQKENNHHHHPVVVDDYNDDDYVIEEDNNISNGIPSRIHSQERITTTTTTTTQQPLSSSSSASSSSSSSSYSFSILGLVSIELLAPKWFYMILGTLDVGASFCIVSALSYTNITSVSLLTAVSIPTTMILSYIFLHRKYTFWHYIGVSMCLLGIILRVGQDWYTTRTTTTTTTTTDDTTTTTNNDTILYPHKLGGDLLACMGGIFFGMNNVLGEVAVQQLGGPYEFLSMMGLFAAIWSCLYAFLWEQDKIKTFVYGDVHCSTSTSILLLLAYVITNWLGYLGGAHFLQMSEATFFNLSFQTGSLWSVLFSIFGQHIFPDPLFYVSLIITVSGVVVYEMTAKPQCGEQQQQLPQNDDDDNDDDLSLSSPVIVSSISLRELS